MHFKHTALALASTGLVAAQRPANMSICDYYTTALLKNNTGANQLTVLTLVVNTAVIGNYTTPNVGIKVDGILAPGMYNGTNVNLLPYFNGDLKSSNRGGDSGVSINFLDGGGAEPLMKNMAANDNMSNQYFLLTHLYEFFGALLGCSQYGMAGYPAYDGQTSMYKVHKFMDLGPNELGYFIQQVAMSAASFGVAQDDLMVVGNALNELFGLRCSPAAGAVPPTDLQLQAICIKDTCPVSPNATCDQYAAAVVPSANSTSSGMPMSTSGAMTSQGSMTMTGTMTSTMAGSMTGSPSSVSSAGAAVHGVSAAALAAAFAALMV